MDMRTKYKTPYKPAFTLVELMVVIMIIALLIGLLLPALRGARQTAIQAQCLAQIRSIALATTNYQIDHEGYYPHAYKNRPGIPATYTQALNSYLGLSPANSNATVNNFDGWHCPATGEGRNVWPEAGIYGHNPNLMPFWNPADPSVTYAPYFAPEYPNQYIRDDMFPGMAPSKLAMFIDCKRPTVWNPPNAPNIPTSPTDYIFPHLSSEPITWASAAYRELATDGTAGVAFTDGHAATQHATDFNTWSSASGLSRIYSFTVK